MRQVWRVCYAGLILRSCGSQGGRPTVAFCLSWPEADFFFSRQLVCRVLSHDVRLSN